MNFQYKEKMDNELIVIHFAYCELDVLGATCIIKIVSQEKCCL